MAQKHREDRNSLKLAHKSKAAKLVRYNNHNDERGELLQIGLALTQHRITPLPYSLNAPE